MAYLLLLTLTLGPVRSNSQNMYLSPFRDPPYKTLYLMVVCPYTVRFLPGQHELGPKDRGQDGKGVVRGHDCPKRHNYHASCLSHHRSVNQESH